MEAGSKMTVYTFQLPSADNSLKGGVEIAQADREKSLTAQHIDNKAVFIDLPTIDDFFEDRCLCLKYHFYVPIFH